MRAQFQITLACQNCTATRFDDVIRSSRLLSEDFHLWLRPSDEIGWPTQAPSGQAPTFTCCRDGPKLKWLETGGGLEHELGCRRRAESVIPLPASLWYTIRTTMVHAQAAKGR